MCGMWAALIAVAFACQPALCAAAKSFCDVGDGWRRAWEDEFNGPDLDPRSWTRQVNGSDPRWDGSCRHARCADDDAFVEGGELVLRSQRRRSCFSGGAGPGCFNFTTGAVTTQNKVTVSANQGFRLCVSAQLPGGGGGGKGQGIWPAHWMMPNDESCDPDEGEIDILEMVDGTGSAQGTYHWQTTWPAKNCSYPTGHKSVHAAAKLEGEWWNEWHEFAVEHTKTELKYVYDNEVILSVSADSPEKPLFWGMPFYLILNTAVGGPWPGEPGSDTVFPTYHRIDYVRLNVKASSAGVASEPHRAEHLRQDQVAAARGCNYTSHPNVTYLDPHNVIECVDGEGADHCRARCDADPACDGIGAYYPLTSGRCCTKRVMTRAVPWPQGESFIKKRSSAAPPGTPCGPAPPPPPPLPVKTTTIFRGNTTFPYSKGAMLELLPGGGAVASLQAGPSEANPAQRVLVATSDDGGATFGPWHVAVPSTGGPQWEPTLFHDAATGVTWLFYTEGPTAVYASQSRSGGRAGTWSPRRLIWNASDHGATRVWVINRLVVLSSGRWVLPCDLGCARPTAAFALVSDDAGASWAATGTVPGTDIAGCPELAVAAVGGGAGLTAVIRNAGVGLLQSRSADGGATWTEATVAGINGASSKPAVAVVDANGTTLVLAYNVETRLEMGLALSRDGGASWRPWGLVDTGEGVIKTFYPTVVVDTAAKEVITVYSATVGENATANRCPSLATEASGASGASVGGVDSEAAASKGCYTDMRLARTPLPP